MNQILLKKLRTETGASFLLCKQALEHTNNQYDEALKYIETHQVKEKGNDRVASKGVVVVTSKDNEAIFFEVNAETDFITKNEYFKTLIDTIKYPLLKSNATNPKAALDVILDDQRTVKQLLDYTAAITKENISLRRFYRVRKANKQSFGTYTHNQGRITSLVVINESNQAVANQLALQVVANQAQYLSYESIDQDTINYEKFMYEKINGSLDEETFVRQMKSISLLDQPFYLIPDQNVQLYLKNQGIHVIDFYRFELGQGIDNKLNCRLDIPCDGSEITVMPVY